MRGCAGLFHSSYPHEGRGNFERRETMDPLRKQVIRIAHENPGEVREALLPLLKEGGGRWEKAAAYKPPVDMNKARQWMKKVKDRVPGMARYFDSKGETDQFYIQMSGHLGSLAKLFDALGNREVENKLDRLADELWNRAPGMPSKDPRL